MSDYEGMMTRREVLEHLALACVMRDKLWDEWYAGQATAYRAVLQANDIDFDDVAHELAKRMNAEGRAETNGEMDSCVTCRYHSTYAHGEPTPWWCARYGEWQEGDSERAACLEYAGSAREGKAR